MTQFAEKSRPGASAQMEFPRARAEVLAAELRAKQEKTAAGLLVLRKKARFNLLHLIENNDLTTRTKRSLIFANRECEIYV